MRNILLAAAFVSLLQIPLRADQQTLEVQQALKDQGFYYGNADGRSGTETTAAVRRYQIRNGLEVSGQLTAETLQSLKVTGRNTAPAITSVPREAPVSEPAPPTDANPRTSPHPDGSVVESDRNFLGRQAPTPAPEPARERREIRPQEEQEVITPRVRVNGYGVLFSRTPYANAPADVQRTIVTRAQSMLLREGFYRGPLDGRPTAELEQALLSFQEDADLPRSGRLDMDTLNDLKMLPGRAGPFPVERTRREEAPSRPVYRGIWVR